MFNGFFFITVFFGFLASFFITYLIRIISIKKKILDIPNHRSSHQTPIPRGGGLSFVLLFYGMLLLLWLHHDIHTHIFLTFLAGIPIAFVGYYDDLYGSKAHWRACVHLMFSALGVYFLGYHSFMFFIFATFVTVWFVNLYNFMDGIDGLAGMEAVFVAGTAGCFLWYGGIYSVAFICFALASFVLGFLVHNWSPAKIFMGDVGSGFLGYVFAMLMLITHKHYQIPLSLWFILLGIFIADASYTLIYRMIQKKKWWVAHREHAYQRLTQIGMTHRKTTLIVLLINIVFCIPLADMYLHLHTNIEIVLYFMSISCIFWFGWFLITKKYNSN